MKNVKSSSTERCSYCSKRALYKSSSLVFRVYACMNHVSDLVRQETQLQEANQDRDSVASLDWDRNW